MEREIKFRAWHKVQKKMYYPDKDNLIYFSSRLCAALIGSKPHLEDTELMQFTGLKDKKITKEFPEGQEIYEGDIVKFKDFSPAEVYYCVNHYRFECDDFDLAEVEESEEIEVIGNIYENPELLTVSPQ